MKLAHCVRAFALIGSLIAVPASHALQYGESRDDLAGADPDWLASWEFEFDRQIETLSSAYELDEDGIAALRVELKARLVQQQEYDSKMMLDLGAYAKKIEDSGVSFEDDNSPLVQQYGQRFLELSQRMPLSDGEVAKWVESRVDPAVAAQGRERFAELQQRRTAEMATGEIDKRALAGKSRSIGEDVVAMKAQMDPNYNRPVPTSDIGERVEAMDRLARVARNIEPTRGRPTNTEALPNNGVPQIVPPPVTHQIPQQPVVPADAKPATPALAGPPRPVVSKPGADVSRAAPQSAKPEPPPQPAPPLDDWEKYVLSTADKYGFNDAQLTNARSILSDLRRRAYQYQASRAESFARVELMTDAKAREAEKKALNRPLDALFAELKVRLDSLPTQSQRQKAGPAPAKR